MATTVRPFSSHYPDGHEVV